MTGCELCEGPGGRVLWQDALCRVVAVDDAHYPGFCRVVATRHVREMTDLPAAQRRALLDVVLAVEEAVRATLRPAKVNLASLGNLTPHVHWHVIPRFVDDRHFPAPVWAEPRRPGSVPAARRRLAEGLGAAIAARLSGSRPAARRTAARGRRARPAAGRARARR